MRWARQRSRAVGAATYSAFWRIRHPAFAQASRLAGNYVRHVQRALERLTAQFQKVLALKHIDPSTLPHQASAFNLFGFLGIMMVTVVLVIGIKESANLNSLIVVVKVCVLIVFLILGGNYILGHRAEAAAN